VLLQTYSGEASIKSYTVFYDRDGAAKGGVIVTSTPSGEGVLNYFDREDVELIAGLTAGARDPVGATGHVPSDAEGINHWKLS
jgi:acetyl-CoA C-acetyltransferase